MRTATLARTGAVLGDRIIIVTGSNTMHGLLGRSRLASGDGLHFPHATFGALHSFGRRFCCDALHLNATCALAKAACSEETVCSSAPTRRSNRSFSRTDASYWRRSARFSASSSAVRAARSALSMLVLSRRPMAQRYAYHELVSLISATQRRSRPFQPPPAPAHTRRRSLSPRFTECVRRISVQDRCAEG